jgi:hypothetical protein
VPAAVGFHVTFTVPVPPAATVSVVGEAVKPAVVPEHCPTFVTESEAVPVLRTVSASVLGVPTVTEPNASGLGVAEMIGAFAGGAVAVPVSGTLYGLGDAFDVNATQEAVATVPAAVGFHVTFTVPVAPAATESVVGETVKPAVVPVQSPMFDTDSEAVPPLLTVSVLEVGVPTVAVPNASGLGVAEMLALAPVLPDSVTAVGLWAVSLELMLKQPVSLPVAVGR